MAKQVNQQPGPMAVAANQWALPDWTFLSNHSHVLYCVAAWPDIRIRDIALKVQITERAVQRIVVDLERGGYLTRERVGRQNQYRLEPHLHLRHPLEHHVEIGRLLSVLQPRSGARARTAGSSLRAAGAESQASNAAPSRLKLKPGAVVRKGSAKLHKLIVRKPR